MSGQSIGSILGGIAGFLIGGPIGAQIGFLAGGLLGSIVAPQHIKGPSIGDAQVQTMQEGVCRPVVYGHPAPFRGNVVDGEAKARKVITEHHQGKGGPVVEQEQFFLTSYIRICETEGDISLVRAWRNGVVVYDARTTFPPGWEGYSDEIRAAQAKWLSYARILPGDDAQLPDPALEALDHNGVGNTPHYRGSFGVVLENEDVTDTGGVVPDYMWEVTRGATAMVLPERFLSTGASLDDLLVTDTASTWNTRSAGATGALLRFNAANGKNIVATDALERFWYSPDRVQSPMTLSASGAFSGLQQVVAAGPGTFVAYRDTGAGVHAAVVSFDGGKSWAQLGTIVTTGTANGLCYGRGVLLFYCGDGVYYSIDKGFTWHLALAANITGIGFNGIGFLASDNFGNLYYSALGVSGWNLTGSDVGAPAYAITGEASYWVLGTFENGIWRADAFGASAGQIIATGAQRYYSAAIGNGIVVIGSGGGGTTAQYVVTNNGTSAALINPGISDVGLSYLGPEEDWLPLPDAPGVYYDPETGELLNTNGYNTVTDDSWHLGPVEADIMRRCKVPAGKIDTTAINAIAIPGFLVAEQYTGAETLSPLMLTYFHDLPEFDARGLVAHLRGGATVADLTEDDLLRIDEDEADAQEDARTRPEDIDFPAKVSVFTQDPDADYAKVPQTSTRFSPDIDASSEVVVQLAVPLSADAAMQVAKKLHKALWAAAEARLTRSLPQEFSTLIPSDSFTYDNRRWLLEEMNFAEGAVQVKASYERASSFSSSATGTPVPTPTPPGTNLAGPTIFRVMNLPSLRPQDNVSGVYMGIEGLLSGYRGANIYFSPDGGETFSMVKTMTQESVMGALVDDEPSAGEPLTVRLYDTADALENATTAQVAAGKNYAAILSADDVAEIISFETATQISSGDWELSNLKRGLMGTTEVGRLSGERFVMLDLVAFFPVDPGLDGQTLVFRAVSIGTAVDSNPLTELVFHVPIFVLDGGGA